MFINFAQYISIVPENWCDKVYYSASTIFLTIIALSAFYTHRIADDFLKAAERDKITINLNEFEYLVPSILIVLIACFTTLMLFDIINKNLYVYISFALVFCIFRYLYIYIKSNIDICMNALNGKDRMLIYGIFDRTSGLPNNRIPDYRKYWNKGLFICFNIELDDQLYYHINIMIVICVLLAINDCFNIIDVQMDSIAFMFVIFVVLLNYAFCTPQIFGVMFIVVLVYMMNNYKYNGIFKFLLLSSCLLTNLFIISLVHANFTSGLFAVVFLIITMWLLFNMGDYIIKDKIDSFKVIENEDTVYSVEDNIVELNNKPSLLQLFIFVIFAVIIIGFIEFKHYQLKKVSLIKNINSDMRCQNEYIFHLKANLSTSSDFYELPLITPLGELNKLYFCHKLLEMSCEMCDYSMCLFSNLGNNDKILTSFVVMLICLVMVYFDYCPALTFALLYILPAVILLIFSYIPQQDMSVIIGSLLFTIYVIAVLNHMEELYLYIMLGLMLLTICAFYIKSYYWDGHKFKDKIQEISKYINDKEAHVPK
jgi:hypothetical protein